MTSHHDTTLKADLAAYVNVGDMNTEDLRAVPTDGELNYEDAVADNNLRAGWAALALLAHTERVGSDEMENDIADLVANLMHLCDGVGIDFDTVLNKAEYHYGDEILSATV